ncbi:MULTISPECIES: molybdenum cofactor guanylyltransferase [Paenibacillus]|nr:MULTISPECIES: molybdenum cofactor guanylyltransferase [Paenibacillus]
MKRRMLKGVIVAGGLNTRMGQAKGLMPIAGQPLIGRTVAEMHKVCDSVVVVANEPELYAAAVGSGAELIADIIPHKGPMSGLHAALSGSSHDYHWVVGCDMPFVSSRVAAWLLRRLEAGAAPAVIPCAGEQAHPLHGLYRRTCLPSVEARIRGGSTGLIRWLHEIGADFATEQELAAAGLDIDFALSFNDPEQYARCAAKAEARADRSL